MSKKDFNQGMEAGAKPFEAKFEKISKDTRKIGENINKKLDGLGEVMDAVIDDLSDIQKKELYNLNTPFDLNEDLDDDEKEILAALLMKLSEMAENNTYQKQFIRSVNNYIGIISPQIGLDISCIENIENINSQKIILQAMMEYLYLECHNFDFLEEFEDIFENFSVNKKGIREIQGYIESVYHAVGAEGIAEKYGYVPEEAANGSDIDHQAAKKTRFSAYDGSDISEACADQVNTHHHYVVLDDYLIYYDDEVMNNKLFCVNKQTGHRREINIDLFKVDEIERILGIGKKGIMACNICGNQDTFYLLDHSGIYQADTEALTFEQIKVTKFYSHFHETFFPQCNEKYLVYFATRGEQAKRYLVCVNLETLENKVILPDESNYGWGIAGFRLVQEVIYFSDEGSDALYKYNLISDERIKIADLTVENNEFLTDNEHFNATTIQYGNLIIGAKGDEMGGYPQNDARYDCLNLENDSFTTVLIPGISGAACFSAYHYVYYLTKDGSIGRYNVLTGVKENIINSKDAVLRTEAGFLKKKVINVIVKQQLQLQVVGKWLYFNDSSLTSKDVYKIALTDEEKKDVILRLK